MLTKILKIESGLSSLLSAEFLTESPVSQKDDLVCRALEQVIALRKHLEQECRTCRCRTCHDKNNGCEDCIGSIFDCEEYKEGKP